MKITFCKYLLVSVQIMRQFFFIHLSDAFIFYTKYKVLQSFTFCKVVLGYIKFHTYITKMFAVCKR